MSTAEYRKEKYDNVSFKIPKGKREEYQRVAESLGLGFWAFLQNGVEEYIANHTGESFTKPEKPESLSADERRLVEEFNQLPSEAQKHLLKFVKAVNQTKGGGENGNN